MEIEKFVEALQLQFADMATEVNAEGESILVNPDSAGLSVLFTSVLLDLKADFNLEAVSVEVMTEPINCSSGCPTATPHGLT